MSPAELTNAHAPQQSQANLTAPCPRTHAQHRATRSAAFAALALWSQRALADSARAWALAAGVPPHLYH